MGPPFGFLHNIRISHFIVAGFIKKLVIQLRDQEEENVLFNNALKILFFTVIWHETVREILTTITPWAIFSNISK